MQRSALFILCILLLLLTACATTASTRYQPQTENNRNPLEAQRLTLKAADLIDTDPEEAERLLIEAITADLYHGPAHNNLGVVYLQMGRLYEAATEFEWARKLMPGHPDPRMNLALTLERAGRINEALATYDTALEVYPGHIPTIQAIARLHVRHGRINDRTSELLREIGLRGEDEQWRMWARERLTIMTAP